MTDLKQTIPPTPVSFLSGKSTLNGMMFVPSTKPRAIAVLNGGTGIPARFYAPFAQWFAGEKGCACLIYDYRDFGSSSKAPMRQSMATMTDWGVYDQEAARAFAKSRFPDIPLWVIGHSLGTLCLPFQKELDTIDRVISVASGLVNVRDHPWSFQAAARLFWFGPVPLLTRAMGFMPGKWLKIGADLPKGVYWQWRRWCTRRGYFSSDIGRHLPYPDWKSLKAPTKIVAIGDDKMIPPPTVWRIMQCHLSAPLAQLVLHPKDYGLESIGHISVFSQKCSATWEDIIAFENLNESEIT